MQYFVTSRPAKALLNYPWAGIAQGSGRWTEKLPKVSIGFTNDKGPGGHDRDSSTTHRNEADFVTISDDVLVSMIVIVFAVWLAVSLMEKICKRQILEAKKGLSKNESMHDELIDMGASHELSASFPLRC